MPVAHRGMVCFRVRRNSAWPAGGGGVRFLRESDHMVVQFTPLFSTPSPPNKNWLVCKRLVH